jgi:hypothetical protein
MARQRKARKLSAAYERRIERYLAAHPGASRSDARGHRRPVGESEYRRRVRVYRERHPDATPAQARGHQSAYDLGKRLKQGSLVSVLGTERDKKTGRLTRVEILVIDPDGSEHTYILEGHTLTQKRLNRLSAEIDRGGGVVSPLYPIRGLEAKAA